MVMPIASAHFGSEGLGSELSPTAHTVVEVVTVILILIGLLMVARLVAHLRAGSTERG